MQCAIVATPILALAEPSQEWRCQTDSLDPALALQRLEWARRCGLLHNTGGTTSVISSTRALDLAALGTLNPWAKEYREIDTNHAFTGNFNTYDVNYYYGYSRYETTPFYTVSQETTGPTAGFWKWSHTTQRARPSYPSFDATPNIAGPALVPLPSVPGDCNLYQQDPSTGVLTRWTGPYYVIAYCESSCYAPDQSLRFGDGDMNVVEAMQARRDDVVTLAPDATLDELATQVSKVYSYTSEIRDGEHVMYQLSTASGGSLRVTNEHPMVTSEGRLVAAQRLVEGDELLKADGSPDPIIKIEKTTHFGKVYNIKPTSREPVANILIAQGYLVGSARFQNDDVKYMNRILLFRAAPADVLPR